MMWGHRHSFSRLFIIYWYCWGPAICIGDRIFWETDLCLHGLIISVAGMGKCKQINNNSNAKGNVRHEAARELKQWTLVEDTVLSASEQLARAGLFEKDPLKQRSMYSEGARWSNRRKTILGPETACAKALGWKRTKKGPMGMSQGKHRKWSWRER